MKLEAKQLSLSRGNRPLFRNLNISLMAGELVFIEGPNGAGKSSLLKLLAGLFIPDKGHISWENRRQTTLSEDIAYLGHKDGLRKALTPIENIDYQLSLANVVVASNKIAEILDTLALGSMQHLQCSKLSAGQKRKVALAALFLKNKPLWILDEPFTALDAVSTALCQGLLAQHLAQGGMVVMASHNPLHQVGNKVVSISLKEKLC